MISRINRADKKAVERIFSKSRVFNTPSLTFRFIITNNHHIPRISFIAPKNIAKLAVRRNLLRRRGYAALGRHIDQFPPGLTGVFIFNKYRDDISTIENEIKDILNRIN